jgi:hypothetical protein
MKKALFFAVLTAVFMAPAYASWDRQDTEKHEKSSHTDIDKRNEGRGYYKGGYEQAYDIKNYNYNRYKNDSDTARTDRKKLDKYYKEWEKFTPEMKESITENYRKWLELSPEQREKIEKAYIKYRSSTAEEKEKIREQARKKRIDR